MKCWQLFVIVLSVGTAFQTIRAQEAADEVVDDNLLQLELRNAAGDRVPYLNERAFALYIGSSGDRAHLLTPYHAVSSVFEASDSLSIWVRPCGSDDWFPATLGLERDRNRDLASISARGLGRSSRWKKHCLDKRPPAGLNAWRLGELSGCDVNSNSGKVSMDRALNHQLRVEPLRVSPGSSGGALISDEGLIGMVIASLEVEDARAVSVEGLRSFAEDADLPWSLDEIRKKPVRSTIAVGLATVAYFAFVDSWVDKKWDDYEQSPDQSQSAYDRYFLASKIEQGYLAVTVGYGLHVILSKWLHLY